MKCSRAEDGAAIPAQRKRAPLPPGTKLAAQKRQPWANLVNRKGRLRLEVLARNSTTKFESRLQFSRFTTNIQNLTFQSPLKLAVKPIVSLVRPTNSLFVGLVP